MALPLRAFSTGTLLYSWEDWHRDNKKEFPVRYFLTETISLKVRRIQSKISNSYHWVRTRTWKRYHMLDIRGPGYDGGWIDRDGVVLYASFKALKDFVEKEMKGVFLEAPPKVTYESDGDYWDRRVETEQELEALYTWWTKEYPKKLKGSTFDLEEEENRMLQRLIEVRGAMWT